MGQLQLISEGLAVPVIRCYPGMRGYQTVPDRAAGVSIASSASANTYGTSTQITAGLAYDAYLVGALMGSPGAGAGDAYAQLGIDLGPSGNVQTVADLKLMAFDSVTATGNIGQTPVMLPYPIFVPAGMRVAAKTARSVATAVSYLVHLIFVPAAEVRTLARVTKGIEAGAELWPDHDGLPSIRTANTGRGSSIVPGASLAAGAACTSGATPAYGSYAQVAANLKYDYLITHILFGLLGTNGQTFVQVALGIGAAGSEFSICDLVLLRETSILAAGELSWPAIALPIGLLVPAGARLAAKIATSGSAITGNIDTTGYYVRDLDQETSTG